MTTAIAGVQGAYVVADSHGNVFYVDGMSGGKVPVTWEGAKRPKAPMSIACGLGGGQETCVIVDDGGNCWRGYARPVQGQPFRPVPG